MIAHIVFTCRPLRLGADATRTFALCHWSILRPSTCPNTVITALELIRFVVLCSNRWFSAKNGLPFRPQFSNRPLVSVDEDCGKKRAACKP